MIILGGSRAISGIFGVVGGPWCKKTRAYVKFGEFFGILVEFWSV
jgi:hypothetical protein